MRSLTHPLHNPLHWPNLVPRTVPRVLQSEKTLGTRTRYRCEGCEGGRKHEVTTNSRFGSCLAEGLQLTCINVS